MKRTEEAKALFKLKKPLVIAIDGPAASGKGTLARRIAKTLGVDYLDTGALYRATARKIVSFNHPVDVPHAVAAAKSLHENDINSSELHNEEIGKYASMIASMPEVRQALLAFQRNFAMGPKGAILDGRDIGTVVCPDAEVKLFITADLASRATRRFMELQHKGFTVIYDNVLTELKERDQRDSQRAIAPLMAAKDAICIDTTGCDAESVFRNVIEILKPYLEEFS